MSQCKKTRLNIHPHTVPVLDVGGWVEVEGRGACVCACVCVCVLKMLYCLRPYSCDGRPITRGFDSHTLFNIQMK